MPFAPSDRRGVTLLELLVTLAVMAVTAGITAFAFRSGAGIARDPLLAARAAAIRGGESRVVVTRDSTGSRMTVTTFRFLPDGRAIGPGRDPLTGLARRDSPPTRNAR